LQLVDGPTRLAKLASMRRVIAILKFLPAVPCGLVGLVLVMHWIQGDYYLIVSYGNGPSPSLYFGTSEFHHWKQTVFGLSPLYLFSCYPIPIVLTLLIPLPVGCEIRIRFPLWDYFAWAALVAAAWTYYLRA
jgi:hypothetical protein